MLWQREPGVIDRVGMRKSCWVLGGLFLFAVVALIGVVAMTVPRWWTEGSKMVREVVAEQKRMADLEATWTPPSEKPDAAWAPAEIVEWKLKQVEAVSGWPGIRSLSITAPMRLAVAIACKPATPTPKMTTRAALTVPAAVINMGKKRWYLSAANITAL